MDWDSLAKIIKTLHIDFGCWMLDVGCLIMDD
jgi:hypothetical protein